MTHDDDILGILKRSYPNSKIALNFGNNWELLVAVVLSAQCTDVMVNKVTKKLFSKMQNAKYKSLSQKLISLGLKNYNPKYKNITHQIQEIINFAEIDIKDLENDIRSTGFYKNKAKNIQNTAKIILDKFQCQVPKAMSELLTLPGVARKTANIILGNAYGIVEGIGVDTHVIRISQRLRLVDIDKIGGKERLIFEKYDQLIVDFVKDADPNKIERELMKLVPKEDWFKFTYMIIDHGRVICKAQNPKCGICPLNKLCPASRV